MAVKVADFPDDEAAIDHAVSLAYLLLEKGYHAGEDRGDWTVSVHDGNGKFICHKTPRDLIQTHNTR